MLQMHTGPYVKYPLLLSDFNDTWIFSTDFEKKNPNVSDLMKIRPVGEEWFHADRQRSCSRFTQFCERA
jgi:hypothetical protein